MFNILKKTLAGVTVAALLFCSSVVPGTIHNASSVQAAKVLSARVSSKKLAVRAKRTATSKALVRLTYNQRVKVLSTGSTWVKVKVGKTIGYAKGKCLTTNLGGTAADRGGVSKGQQVANYALKFLGNPYRYGGTSLTHGTDCSGFVMSVYRHFGKRLPRTSSSQRHAGRRVAGLSAAKPGDIICYNGHVAIYLGNKKIVHASNPKSGIKITRNANYRHIVSIRRVF